MTDAFASISGRCNRLFVLTAGLAGPISMAFLAAGFSLMLASIFWVGNDSVRFFGRLDLGAPVIVTDLTAQLYEMGKQVGYISAPNWSLPGIPCIAVALYYLLRARSGWELSLERLAEAGQIRRTGNAAEVIGEATLRRAWNLYSLPLTVIAIAIIIGSAYIVVVQDYFRVVASAYEGVDRFLATCTSSDPALRALKLNDRECEFDWSVAAVFAGSPIDVTANRQFALLAYIVVVFVPTAIFVAGIVFLGLSGGFFGFAPAAYQFELIPDIDSTDRERLGMERFGTFIESYAIAGFFIGLALWTIHIQNVFLRDPAAPALWPLFANDIHHIARPIAELFGAFALPSAGIVDWTINVAKQFGDFIDAVAGIPGQLDWLIERIGGGKEAVDLPVSSLFVVCLIPTVSICLLLFSIVTLRDAARRGRDRALELAGQGRLAHRDGSPATPKDIADLMAMRFWPAAWIDVTVFICLTLLIVAAVFWERLILLLVAVPLAFAVQRLVGPLFDRLNIHPSRLVRPLTRLAKRLRGSQQPPR